MNWKYLLVGIILLAASLRFFQLGVNPPSLTWDEVAWGYNAYALGIDGKDEFGRFLPYDYLESYGDFKPPVYAYLDILPVKFFGLNEFAVRFPAALFGVFTVLVTFFLTRRIFSASVHAKHYALGTTFLLAISPWHIMLSRAAFEANVASFFIVTGMWLFLESLHKRKWLLMLSAVCFVASLYTFNSARIAAPILLLGLTIGYWKTLWSMKRQVISAAIVGFILLLPTLSFLFSPQARLRYQEVNIFSNIDIIKHVNQEVINDQDVWWSKIIHNRRVLFGIEYVKHYFDNLSPSFLFVKGDGNPKFSTQALGQMYLFELPLFIAGILFLIRKREKNWWIIPFWLLGSIIPAAVARETPHALRIENSLPMFQILVAYGMVQLYLLLHKSKKTLKKVVSIIFAGVVLYSISYFLEDYYFHYPKYYSGEWQYGYKNAITYMEGVEDQYGKIFLTRSLGRPYAYMLFYKQYDPERFRKEANVQRDAFGFVNVLGFNKYYFEKEELKKTKDKNILYLDSPVDVPSNAKIKKIFTTLEGQKVIVAYTL